MNKEQLKYHRTKYDTNEAENTHLYLTSQMIENNSHILEIGCSTGYFSLHLQEDKNCNVLALDISEQSVEITSAQGINAIVADVENSEIMELLQSYTDKNGKFDCITCNDVIEHLKYPEILLQRMKGFLKTDGYMIISVPNIAFWKIRFGLLFGNFDYTEVGILDNTHLKFFTIKSFKEFVVKNGYKIVEFKSVYSSYFNFFLSKTKKFFLLENYLHPLLKRLFDGLYTFQIVAKIKL